MRVRVLGCCAAALLASGIAGGGDAWAGQLRAGAASVDATWHVGASAGQYATTKADDPTYDAEFDPNAQTFKNEPSYGVQSRLEVRAVVVQEQGGRTVAIAKTDLYIPQDLLWRRAAQLLSDETNGLINESNLTMGASHDHSSPYYSSTGAGAWAFQDVFDIRFYTYYARRIADAVEAALKTMRPARMGASVTTLDDIQQNVPGPSRADNGTPAGYPKAYGDHDVSVVRFDGTDGKPIGQIVGYSLHGESLDGNDLISADWVGPFQRMMDRQTGGTTVFLQQSVGNSETEENTSHGIHRRFWFEHKQYAQTDLSARRLADAAGVTWKRIADGTPDPSPRNAPRFVPFTQDAKVDSLDRWFFGPISHPFPTVSNCRTDTTLSGGLLVPVLGVPDCERSPISSPFDPGLSAGDLGLPSNYGAPSYGALEESLGIHLQAIRLGPILLTMCSCEQWADQAENIRTRTDRTPGNEWLGYDWADPNRPNSDGAPGCERDKDGTWSCPNPETACTVENEGERFCRAPATPDTRIKGISDRDFQVMRAQVLNDAAGWDDPSCSEQGCGLQAESEPADPAKIRGNYTHDDTTVRGGTAQTNDYANRYGYTLTIPFGMVNDYNGYIATYREYQRGDHYRKALTAWGPHSSDYLATRLVRMGHALNGDAAALDQVDRESDPAKADPVYGPLAAKEVADRNFNDARAKALGAIGTRASEQYASRIPDNGGKAEVLEQPKDVQRFDAAFFSWNGGDNYTDNPNVVVERKQADASWKMYADQSGELPVTLKLPAAAPDAQAVYLAGGQTWRWTATFEAFASRYDLGDRPRATPPGTYRFVAKGLRQEGGAQKPYTLTSKPFAVGAWSGITADDVRREANGTVSFTVGPVTTRAVPGANPAQTVRIGPIDYPDSYAKAANDPAHGVRYVKDVKQALRDPEAPADPSRFEWYCLACSFRPWLDFGSAKTATVTFAGPRGVTRAPATLRPGGDAGCPPGPTPGVSLCGRWRTTRALRAGEAAYVCPGDLQDAYGNYNGALSAAVTASRAPVELACRPLAELVDGPIVPGANPATPGRGAANGEVAGRGQTGPASALGLPGASSSKRVCGSRRRFRIRIRAPHARERLRSARVRVDGRRVRVRRRHGRLTAVVDLRGHRRGRAKVRIVVITAGGRRYAATRVYHVCTSKRRSGRRHGPKL